MAVLGLVREAQGRYREALECQRLGLEAARSAGNLVQEGSQLINLGYIHLRLEEYETAAELYRKAHTLLDQCGQRRSAHCGGGIFGPRRKYSQNARTWLSMFPS